MLGLIGMLKGLAAASIGNVTGTIGIATTRPFVATLFGILFANLLWLRSRPRLKNATGNRCWCAKS
ncbi:MAG: hypothetical protein M3R30_07435 [Candidatus Eremiobacteraeota bacterium]|nr:hypothetical protein [Candidatus Eremiobacteraeota bacterium]